MAVLVLLGIVVTLSAGAQMPVLEANSTVDDVTSAFAFLRHQGEWLAAWPGLGMPISGILGEGTDKHYQGIQRPPFHPIRENRVFYVTRSGRVDDPLDLGFLAVVGFGSRERDGERFRSNLLVKDVETSSTLPPFGDGVMEVIYFADYQHPGGIQMVGDILAVPLETPKAGLDLPPGKIRFYDCSDRTRPVALKYELDLSYKVGVLAITKLPEPDGHFLLLLTGGDNSIVESFRSNKTSFFEPGFQFERHHIWAVHQQPGLYWPTSPSFQSLNFVNQADGRLYLVCCMNTSPAAPILNGDDYLFLYKVTGWQPGASLRLAVISNLHVNMTAKDEPLQTERFGNGNAGGGVYVSPTGELLYYMIYHYDVPDWGGIARLRMAELRHFAVNRHFTCGPQFRPNHLGGPYTIQEDERFEINGTVHVVQPWVDMYGEVYFTDRAEMMDYADQMKDDYQDFSKLDGAGVGGSNGFGDEMTSFLWCGPPEYLLQICEDDNFGGARAELVGTGSVEMSVYVGEWFDNKASSARIIPIAPPPEYDYAWDIDGDGVFGEFLGESRAYFRVTKRAPSETVVSMRYGDTVVSTTVFVSSPLDINGDGHLDATDIQLAINAALGFDISPYDADVNESGRVDAVDLQMIINGVLGL